MRYLTIILILAVCGCPSRFTYEEAQRRGTIDAYYRFISENPDAPEAEEALSKIKDTLFTAAFEKRDVVLIKRFISEFPNDRRAETLYELLDEIRFEEAKKKNTKTAYELFAGIAKNRKLKDEAERLIQEIEYNEIKESNDIHKIDEFLKRNDGNPHYSEVNKRLMNLLFESIKNKNVFYAHDFLSRFPDSEKKDEITGILIDDLAESLYQFCLFDGIERLTEPFKNNLKIQGHLTILAEKKNLCEKYYNLYSALIQGSLKKSELGRLISEKSDAKEKTTLFKLLKNYRSTLDSVSDAVRMLNSERPDKRRGAYTYLSNYPLSPGAVLALVERLFDATLFERMEIAGILKDKAENYTEKRLLNFLFFVNRERKIYSVYRGFFFERSENYESLNMLLNKLFSDAREDMLLQYLIIEEAYNRGYNSFIRSVANEHIKQFFSVISEFQSGCQEECSIRILYELKGCQVILLKEREIAKTVFGESSDLFSILSEKEAEITKLLEKYKFALQKPVISDPSEGQPLDRLNLVNEKQILKFLYQAEPDISKRKTIVKILGE